MASCITQNALRIPCSPRKFQAMSLCRCECDIMVHLYTCQAMPPVYFVHPTFFSRISKETFFQNLLNPILVIGWISYSPALSLELWLLEFNVGALASTVSAPSTLLLSQTLINWNKASASLFLSPGGWKEFSSNSNNLWSIHSSPTGAPAKVSVHFNNCSTGFEIKSKSFPYIP